MQTTRTAEGVAVAAGSFLAGRSLKAPVHVFRLGVSKAKRERHRCNDEHLAACRPDMPGHNPISRTTLSHVGAGLPLWPPSAPGTCIGNLRALHVHWLEGEVETMANDDCRACDRVHHAIHMDLHVSYERSIVCDGSCWRC